ncbi:MAG: hypothetical protein MRY32_02065 [Rickettsiales bacterium]|nr:hypothetical protein [Rickettsiales bacterium]
MTQDEKDVINQLEILATEQVMFMKNRYHMQPEEIIKLYGGQCTGSETYGDAIERIAAFNMFNAAKNGFLAS